MDLYLCIHGHFYQPARDNPWLDAVELQDAAAPYHDWNERITAECYAANAAARILNNQERILRIVNNYTRISFNIGPTLLRWLARHAPTVYGQIQEADLQSRQEHFAHGNAIAQVYNHVIMPLASSRDQLTQVRWGIRDFERRFHRYPEGMWLPETAVDVATLEVLAAHRILFTILAPHQARRVRASMDAPWTDARTEELDATIPYRCRLPSGRSITIFFYDAPISRAIAFEGLLNDGAALAERLQNRLAGAAGPELQAMPGAARILTIATDGESYGHHHRFGEMALSYALRQIETQGAVRITNFGAYLAAHPPVAEVEISDNTSWSCAHGIERWRSDCGCNTGQGWHQRWRGPLRQAITWLKRELDQIYERRGGELLTDPWAARDDAVELTDGDAGAPDAFFRRRGAGPLAPERRSAALRLLEMQRQGMLMQSSDGWFFDELSGTETVQILAHASRAIDLARAFGATLEDPFLQQLRAAPGNLNRFPDGAMVYEKLVTPMAVPTRRLVAIYATSSLVDSPPAPRVYATSIRPISRDEATSGQHTLVAGRVRTRSLLTEEEEDASYVLLHFGGHEVHCAVQLGWPEQRFASFRTNLLQRFGRDVLSEVMRTIDVAFGATYFSLHDLPLEDRRRVLVQLTAQTLGELEGTYRHVYQENRALMEYLRAAQVPVPQALILAAVYVVTRDLELELRTDATQMLPPKAFALIEELRSWGREVRQDRFEPLLRQRLEAVLASSLPVSDRLRRAGQVLDLAHAAGLTINLWEAQNKFYRIARLAQASDTIALIREIGTRLNFNIEALEQAASGP